MTQPAIIIIGGGILSCYAIRRAKELGFTTICTDRDPACLGAQEADAFEKADVYSINEQIVAALKLQQCYGKALKGIFVGGIDAAHVASSVARVMGWPGTNPQAAWLCRRKDLFRQRMKECGVRQPLFSITSSDSHAVISSDKPFIVKSVENSGGRGHSIFIPAETRAVPSEYYNAALDKAAAANLGGSQDVLIEELLSGREFSVEIVFDSCHPYAVGGSGSIVTKPYRWHGLNLVERYFAADGSYPIEIGHVNPAPITAEQQDKLYRLAGQCAEAVEASWGVFKIDAIWPTDSPEPYVLEATCRWSGGFDSQETTPLSTGRDFLGFGIRLAAGEPITVNNAALQPRWQRVAAAWYPLPKSMVLDHIDTTEAARVPGVEKIIIMPSATPGTQIDVHDSASRPLTVIASGETIEDALAVAKEGAAKVRFVAR